MEVKLENIEVGNKVYFESMIQNNYNLYWEVKSKLNNQYYAIKVNEDGINDSTIIHISEVTRVE